MSLTQPMLAAKVATDRQKLINAVTENCQNDIIDLLTEYKNNPSLVDLYCRPSLGTISVLEEAIKNNNAGVLMILLNQDALYNDTQSVVKLRRIFSLQKLEAASCSERAKAILVSAGKKLTEENISDRSDKHSSQRFAGLNTQQAMPEGMLRISKAMQDKLHALDVRLEDLYPQLVSRPLGDVVVNQQDLLESLKQQDALNSWAIPGTNLCMTNGPRTKNEIIEEDDEVRKVYEHPLNQRTEENKRQHVRHILSVGNVLEYGMTTTDTDGNQRERFTNDFSNMFMFGNDGQVLFRSGTKIQGECFADKKVPSVRSRVIAKHGRIISYEVIFEDEIINDEPMQIIYHHLPLVDRQPLALTDEELCYLCQINADLSDNQKLLLHCAAGIGRSGAAATILAAQYPFYKELLAKELTAKEIAEAGTTARKLAVEMLLADLRKRRHNMQEARRLLITYLEHPEAKIADSEAFDANDKDKARTVLVQTEAQEEEVAEVINKLQQGFKVKPGIPEQEINNLIAAVDQSDLKNIENPQARELIVKVKAWQSNNAGNPITKRNELIEAAEEFVINQIDANEKPLLVGLLQAAQALVESSAPNSNGPAAGVVSRVHNLIKQLVEVERVIIADLAKDPNKDDGDFFAVVKALNQYKKDVANGKANEKSPIAYYDRFIREYVQTFYALETNPSLIIGKQYDAKGLPITRLRSIKNKLEGLKTNLSNFKIEYEKMHQQTSKRESSPEPKKPCNIM